MKIFLNTQSTEEDITEVASGLSRQGFDSANSLSPHVAILMCTYNGHAYLKWQMASFNDQSFTNWTLYVSDDASTDETREMLADYQRCWGAHRLVIFDGPGKGFAANFMSLVRRPEIKGDYFAFSDQDDVWFKDRLERGVKQLEVLDKSCPALYCTRTRLVNSCLEVIGMSPFFSRPPSFKNALVQSIAGANTMLINSAARELLVLLPEQTPIVAHDWLSYLLITGCGGQVVYEFEPSLDYRQHGGNLIGANSSFSEKLSRFRQMLSGRFAVWNDKNLVALKGIEPYLTGENLKALEFFSTGRKSRLFKRVIAMWNSGVYRQTIQGNVSLVVAILLGRI